jgi:hypothetical protein
MKSENGRYRLLFILGLIWAVNSSLFARVTSVIEIAAGGGWSTLNYAVSSPIEGLNVRQNGSWSVTAHSEYIIMFNRYIGIGAGVDITHYGAITAIDGRMQWTGVTDTDGEVYNHHLSITGWRDKQDVWFLQPGLFIHADIPVGDNIAITFAGGGRYGLPIAQRMSYGGTTCHTGVYPQWGLTLSEMENHGFYTTTATMQTTDWKANRMIDLVLRAGVQYHIGKYTALMVRAWVACGVTDALRITSSNQALGFANDKPGMEKIHYFMNDYTSVLATNLVTDPHSKPIAAGLEIGVRWIFPHPSKRTNICRCLNVYR